MFVGFRMRTFVRFGGDIVAGENGSLGSPGNNPRIPDADEIQALYREAWA